MRKDARGLSVTCASDRALETFERGLYWALSLDSSGIDELRGAIHEDPNFGLAYALLARQLWIHGFAEEAEGVLAKAQSLADSGTPREAAAIEITYDALKGSPKALPQALSHIETYPSDCFVLSHVIGPFGLLAFSGDKRWRERNVELIDQVRNGYSQSDWWYNTSVAFLYAEVGLLSKAERFAQRAWEQKENGNTAHSLAHLHFERNAVGEGLDFIEKWLVKYGSMSDMHHHLVWHQQLLRLSQRNVPDLLSIYDSKLQSSVSDPMPLTTLCDNASLLWRCVLLGTAVPKGVGSDVLIYAKQHFPNSGFVFADIHRAMAAAIADVECDLSQSPQWLRNYFKAFRSFVSRDFETVASLLEEDRENSVLLGGSNAQRQIIDDTLQAAKTQLQH